mmetsp:Transcript_69292/g.193285  ORF Transcript_69292/g.193285 Transcript_69292/m.193285 type:complete len:263 (-) Transcript_69292:327-1115(-)
MMSLKVWPKPAGERQSAAQRGGLRPLCFWAPPFQPSPRGRVCASRGAWAVEAQSHDTEGQQRRPGPEDVHSGALDLLENVNAQEPAKEERALQDRVRDAVRERVRGALGHNGAHVARVPDRSTQQPSASGVGLDAGRLRLALDALPVRRGDQRARDQSPEPERRRAEQARRLRRHKLQRHEHRPAEEPHGQRRGNARGPVLGHAAGLRVACLGSGVLARELLGYGVRVDDDGRARHEQQEGADAQGQVLHGLRQRRGAKRAP